MNRLWLLHVSCLLIVSNGCLVLCNMKPAESSDATSPAKAAASEVSEGGETPVIEVLPSELTAEVLSEGDCNAIKPVSEGDTLTLHYEGILLTNNEKFDSSLDRDEPFIFTLGKDKVVEGWNLGLLGMCVGERRMLTIPPHLAYGSEGVPPSIPPDAALKYDIILLDKE